jgi:CubicO group peptidase (beta-lactamase class C family)
MNILVIGATGRTGQEIVGQSLGQNARCHDPDSTGAGGRGESKAKQRNRTTGNETMTSKQTTVATALVFTILTGSLIAGDSNPPASPEVAAAMQPYLDQFKLAGVVAVITDRTGKVHYKNLLGYADVEAKKPISEDSVFWIASMTKMFAGASVMMLVDEGKVSLDDPVTKFIPQLNKWMVVAEKDLSHVLLKPPVRPVTIRHLLSHTSGLAGTSELQQVTGADSTPLKARALSSVTGPLQWQPGD